MYIHSKEYVRALSQRLLGLSVHASVPHSKNLIEISAHFSCLWTNRGVSQHQHASDLPVLLEKRKYFKSGDTLIVSYNILYKLVLKELTKCWRDDMKRNRKTVHHFFFFVVVLQFVQNTGNSERVVDCAETGKTEKVVMTGSQDKQTVLIGCWKLTRRHILCCIRYLC